MTEAAGASGGPVVFAVDLAQLNDLHQRVNEIRRDVIDIDNTQHKSLGAAGASGGGIEVFGAAIVVSAVESFIENWVYGRGVITDELESISQVVQKAESTYTSAESALTY